MSEQRAIQAGTTAAVLLVAAIAAVISFVHIAHLAVTHGQTVLASLLLPVSIDGTVAAASLVMLRAARLQVPTPWLARLMLAASVAATLAANISYGSARGPVCLKPFAGPGRFRVRCASWAVRAFSTPNAAA